VKAVVKKKAAPGIDLLDVEVPEVRDTDILIEVRAGSLCGSDVHIYEWTAGYDWMPLPLTIGHEFSGEVVKVGDKVATVAAGDRVTAMPTMPCSRCSLCQVGKGESCLNRWTLGLRTDGVFAEYVRLTAGATLFRLPDNLSFEAAALCEPLCVALKAIDLSGIKLGEKAAILGPGPIGLLTLQLLKAAGVSLNMMAGTTADIRRLKIARKLGADVIIEVEKEDPVENAMKLTGAGFDFVFEASGNPKSVSQGLNMVRPGGKVILIGIHSGPAQFNPTGLVRGKKSIIGAYGYEPETWQRALSLLSSRRIMVEEMITHRIPLTEAQRGFELAAKREAAKVIFIP
jgi:2-desacetyl-2-hydroxyethyl bacteriochlorophyllide A dehydrogenase